MSSGLHSLLEALGGGRFWGGLFHLLEATSLLGSWPLPPSQSQWSDIVESLCFCHGRFSPSASIITSPSLTRALLPPSYKDSLDYIRATQTIQDNLPPRILSVITPATRGHILIPRFWRFEQGRLWKTIILPSTEAFPPILGSGLFPKGPHHPVCEMLDVTTSTLIRMPSAQAFFMP